MWLKFLSKLINIARVVFKVFQSKCFSVSTAFTEGGKMAYTLGNVFIHSRMMPSPVSTDASLKSECSGS